MQKIIIDTNILVSALIQRSYPYFIIYNYAFENLVEVCLSDELLEEYLDVIHRPKFARYPDFLRNAGLVLNYMNKNAKKYNPQTTVDAIKDKDDNMLLELALEAKADFIITGNTNDFVMPEFEGTKIVTPKEYWDNYRT
jgi:hypothetical protein